MTLTISAILFLIAGILALLAAFNVGAPRYSMGWVAVALIAFGLMTGGLLR